MKSLTICFVTSRPEPKFEWFRDSLAAQMRARFGSDQPKDWSVIWIDALSETRSPMERFQIVHGVPVLSTTPKPTVWQGKHRLTKCDWWAMSNARNTGICLCRTDWISFCDDRSVLMPGWLDAVIDAMAGNYVVVGAYEKRHHMTVENGAIRHGGIITGEDSRETYIRTNKIPTPFAAPGEWLFGCSFALPIEWALAVNGHEELCDGLGMEDILLGMMLKNNGYPIKYDPRMKIVEDRTPGQTGGAMKRTSKERWANDQEDKGHKALARFRVLKRTEHQANLKLIRESVLRGGPFPIPNGPTTDWFDGQPLSEM